MSNHNIVTQYLSEIQKILNSGDAREHAYRPAFQRLIEELVTDVQVINEPAYSGGNAPDFLFKKGDIPIAYAECKDVTVDISDKGVQKQAERYVNAFGKILLTNYYDFQIIDETGVIATCSIAEKSSDNIISKESKFVLFENLIRDYITPSHRTIRSAKKLAEIMASKARLLRDNTLASFIENKESEIYSQYLTFKEVLIHDLSEQEFVDMYAQTLVYGLFVARYFDNTLQNFSRHEAHDLLPSTNPLLKKFFGHVAGTEYDQKIAWMVDSLVETYKSTDVHELMHKEFEKKQKDPVLHFYETFLSEYDKGLRKNRGVYYTPEPIVSFIVRSVDQILKSKFNLPKGLADSNKIDHTFKVQAVDARTKDGVKQVTLPISKVQILDPAVGTGTFLNEVIHEIHKSFVGQEGMWSSYVKEHLLPRLHGFELMMASYTMAHLKLGVTLKELGYEGNERLSVWLTNSLEESVHEVPNLFMSKWLTEESNQASKIKSEMPIMVVIGNPPYSGESFNKNYSGHDVYKVEPGGKQKLQERNSKWINDDYVKFIRFAEKQIEKTGEGIVSFITPHGYLDNPTFRGMRWHLMQTFDEIYVLDLHGNSNKKETSLDGGKDENVFGIKTGAAIIFALKNISNNKKSTKIYHTDFYGKQDGKFRQLNENDWLTIKWKELSPTAPAMYFVPFDEDVRDKYEEGFSVEQMFLLNGTGIVTKRDNLCITDTKENCLRAAKDILEIPKVEFYSKYDLPEDVRDWKYEWAKKDIEDHVLTKNLVKEISYRPFDTRFIYYTGRSRGFVGWPVDRIMKHFIRGKNVGLLLTKGVRDSIFNHVFITTNISEAIFLSGTTATNAMNLPLYLYADDGSKVPNLDKGIWNKINEEIGETQPEDVLDYIYAVLHSPSYREKYKEFLKIDFPRVPFPGDKEKFWKLVELGRELRELHLLESSKVNNFVTTFSVGGSNRVQKGYPKFQENTGGHEMKRGDEVSLKGTEMGNIWINENQYFGNVPEIVWNFYIGGYQPTQKWLKDRRGRELTSEDIVHYQKMIVALVETDRIMKEIDSIV